MQAWFEDLQARNLVSGPLTVTGYSLGGHLATAFNLLYPSAVTSTYTFNGAGVGLIDEGQTLAQVMQAFSDHKDAGTNLAYFTDAQVRGLYQELSARYTAGAPLPDLTQLATDKQRAADLLGVNGSGSLQALRLHDALERVESMALEALRIAGGITSGSEANGAQVIDTEHIAALALDYQLAVLHAAQFTEATRTVFDESGVVAYAEHEIAPNPIANFFDVFGAPEPSAVAYSQIHYGTPVGVWIEDQPLLRGEVIDEVATASGLGMVNADFKLLVNGFSQNDFGDTHSLVLLIDSLTVQSTLARMQTDIDLKTLSGLLHAADCQKADFGAASSVGPNNQGLADGSSLERIVNLLAEQLGVAGAELAGNPNGNTWHVINDQDGYSGRTALHQRLVAIDEQIEQFDLAGRFTLTPFSSADGSNARLDFGTFLALQCLSPFVLDCKDPAAQAALDTTWQQVHGDLYLAWAADRNAALYGDTTHDYTYSDQWLADRATLLQTLNTRNRQNNDSGQVFDPSAPAGQATILHFTDPISGEAEVLITRPSGGSVLPDQHILFGGDGADTLMGFNNAKGDRLYGGAGADTLTGLGGADHLEGGVGNDTLDGGAGNDRLLGGSGLDTYVLDGSAGTDVLIDEDGGVIRYLDQVLTGGQERAPGSGEWQDGAVRYHLMADGDRQHLLISAGAGTVLVQDWHNGHLGIQLQDAPAAPPAPSADLVLHGDRAPLDTDPATDGVQSSRDELGNVIVKPNQIEADRLDTIYDSTGNDQIFGHGGNDSLNAWRGGNDFIDGGAGHDHVRAGAGDDVLIGGEGLDRLFGQDGRDRLYADLEQSDARVFADHVSDTEDTQGIAEQGELLVGGSGDDWQVGHRRADLLLGGLGRDQLWGGAGDDVLYGDLDASSALPGWKVQRVVQTPQSDFDPAYVVYSWDINHLEVDTSIAGGDDDVHGGAGNDWLMGEGGQDRLDGGSGDDVLIGGTGSDWLEGGDGRDHLIGDHGANSSNGQDHDHLSGGAGDDELWGDAGHDQLFGGDGNDSLMGDNARSDGALHGNDFLDGGAGDDMLWGHGGADQLLGGSGADVLWGDDDAGKAINTAYHGEDLLMGEDGNDVLVGGGGADNLLGGEGHDAIYGDDISDAPALYTVEASAHGDDWLDGGAGNDVLYGGGGADHLLGGAGDDELHGGDGNDTLDGGSGLNRLEGGAGDDTYVVRGADLAQAAPAEGQAYGVPTTIGDTEGRNTIRVDALQRDIALLPLVNDDGSFGVSLVWHTGSDDQGQPQVAALGLDSLALAGGFTIEFADGQRVALSRWVGDAMEASITAQSFNPGDVLTGAAGDDHLSVYGQGSQVMGGHGDDTITLNADGTLLHFDRGDGHDVLQGWYGDHRIAFGAGIEAEHLSLRLTLQGALTIAIANPDGSDSTDRIKLPVSPGALLSTGFLNELVLADGRTLSWQDLLAQGVRIEALAGASRVDGTQANDHFADMPQGAMLSGGLGDDQYHVSPGLNATVQDSEGINRIVFGTDVAPTWNALQVQRAAPGADGRVSNDLLLSAGGATIRLVGALALGDRFEVALANGRTRSLADMIRTLPAMGVEGSTGRDHLIGGDGNDLLLGQAGNDTMDGQGGNDALLGGLGDDVYLIDLLRAGHDQIADPQGLNVVRFAPGVQADALQAERLGDSTDLCLWLDDGSSLTVRRALEGAVVRYEFDDGSAWTLDTLVERLGLSAGLSLGGSPHNDQLAGTVLGDLISAGVGDDTLLGKAGNDELLGGDGADSLDGGQGSDTLRGGAGADRYTFQLGDGVDQLIDTEGASLVRFGPGITPDQLSATRETIDGLGYVRLRYSADDAVLIRDDAPQDTLSFAFDDGDVRGARPLYAEILVGSGASVAGTAGDDKQFGTASADALQGLDGMDTLQGGAGNDHLDGGAGSDFLYGGGGLDSYALRANAGLDRLYEVPGQVSRLVLDGVASEALSYARVGNDLLVQDSSSNAASFIQGAYTAYTAGTRWTLVDAQGQEHDLLALASRAIAAQTPEQSQAAFAQAADAQAGLLELVPHPLWRDTASSEWQWQKMLPGDYAGTYTLGTGTTEAYVYHLHKPTQRTENDEAEVLLSGQRDVQSVRRESVATVERTETYWGERLSHYEYTTVGSIPDRTMPLLEYMGNASMVVLPEGAYLVGGDHSGAPSDQPIYLYIPGDIRTISTPVYEPAWVTQTYMEHYYRTTYDSVRLTEVYQGGDSANHVTLTGSASKIVSTGGGDDVIESLPNPSDVLGRAGVDSSDWIDGGSGNDRILSGKGNDELHGGMGRDHLDGGAGADTYVVDAMDDSWDVIDERAAPRMRVTIAMWMYFDSPPIAELQALAADTYAQQGPFPRQPYYTFDVPATADKLNALMRLDQRPLMPANMQWGDNPQVHPYTAVRSPDLDDLIARVSGQAVEPASGPRPRIHFDDEILRTVNADTVRLGPGIDATALQARWSSLDTDEGPRRALSLSWGGPGGVHVLMPEDDTLPGAGIERFEFADGTVWTMEQMASLVPQVPPMPESPLINTGPATTAYVGPNQIAVAAVPGLPDLMPWDDEPSPDWPEPAGLQEQRWVQDLMHRQYEQAFQRSWGSAAPRSQEPLTLQSDPWGASPPATAQAAFDAQVSSLIQAMAAFATPPMASFSASNDTHSSAWAPVLAVNPL